MPSYGSLRGVLALSVAASALFAPPAATIAQAQVVDVCTGVSLPRSALTDFMGDVNGPLVAPLEGQVNGLLDIVDPLNLILPDLSIDLTTILANAALGAPISIDVLDSDGNVVSPGNCNVAVDGVTLNTEAGISIGGNAVTGLGANGEAAVAGEIDSIAIGNNAATAPAALSSVAIGRDASATASNSVALGAGSIADRGPQIAYAAPGIVGTSDSVGSVSVGAAGSLRQITNVAPGTSASDAATVGQVQGALDATAALAANTVLYDDAGHLTVTFDGAGGTLLTGVAPGTLSAASSDAVNGSQLYATNQNVSANTTAITNLTTQVTQVAADVAAITTNSVQYSDASQTSVVLGGAGGTTISNLANGAVSASSTEAINGSQLHAVQQQVDGHTTAIGNLTVRIDGLDIDIASLDSRVTYTESTLNDVVTRVTVNEGAITNLTTEIAAVDSRVTVNEGAITQLQALAANIPVGYVSDADGTTPSATATNTAAMRGAGGDPVRLTNVAAGQIDPASTDAVNGAQLAATNQQVAGNTATISQHTVQIAGLTDAVQKVPVQYSNSSSPTSPNGGIVTNDVTLVGANAGAPVGLHNVARGTLGSDAVNLAQLLEGIDGAVATSRSYTDLKVSELAFNLGELREASFAGTAGALAASGLPQVTANGGSMIAGAVGHYRGQTAFAIGFSSAIDDGQAVLKVNGTVDTHGYAGVSAGAGFAF